MAPVIAPAQPRPLATFEGARPDPAQVRSEALAPAWRASAAYALALAALAVGAPSWTGGDARAALLPGVPAAVLTALFLLGRAPTRRRVTMSLATATAGFLALTTVSSLGAVGRVGGEGSPAVLFQVGCLASSTLFLAITAPAWKRVNAEGARADALLRMYDEL